MHTVHTIWMNQVHENIGSHCNYHLLTIFLIQIDMKVDIMQHQA